jgi:hypothetical protein
MGHLYIPHMVRIPDGTIEEERVEIFEEYKAEIARHNQIHFNHDESRKSFLQWLIGLFAG